MGTPSLPISLHLKSMIVGTPLEAAAIRLRWLLGTPHRHKHPELWDLYLEEERLDAVLQKVLAPESCGVDVGSHLGSFLLLLRQYAPKGRHTAFEASTGKSAWLKAKFPEVDVCAVAVAEHTGKAIFKDDLVNSGYSSLQQREHQAVEANEYEVETCRLDDILLGKDRIDIIKMDIEGGELPALRGAIGTIRKWSPVLIFECGTQYSFDKSNQNRADIYDYVTQELGYQIYTYVDYLHDKGELSGDEFRKCGLFPFRALNFIALPRQPR